MSPESLFQQLQAQPTPDARSKTLQTLGWKRVQVTKPKTNVWLSPDGQHAVKLQMQPQPGYNMYVERVMQQWDYVRDNPWLPRFHHHDSQHGIAVMEQLKGRADFGANWINQCGMAITIWRQMPLSVSLVEACPDELANILRSRNLNVLLHTEDSFPGFLRALHFMMMFMWEKDMSVMLTYTNLLRREGGQPVWIEGPYNKHLED